jgi:hypothetical protein
MPPEWLDVQPEHFDLSDTPTPHALPPLTMLELCSDTCTLRLFGEELEGRVVTADIYDADAACDEGTEFTHGSDTYALVTPIKQGFYSSVLYGLTNAVCDSWVMLEKQE